MIYNQLVESTASFSDRTAIVDKNRVFKYSHLLNAIQEMSIFLGKETAKPGKTIDIQIRNSLEFVISFYSTVKTGTNILLLDSSLKPEEIQNYLKLTESIFLLCQPTADKENGYNPVFKYSIPFVFVPEIKTEDTNYISKNYSSKNNKKSSVFYLLSSGSTGIPKIIVRSTEQTLSVINIFNNTLPYNEEDRVMALLPFTHSFGFLNVLLSTLSCGATLYIESFSPRSTANKIKEHGITVLPATPFIFRMLNETTFQNKPDFSSLRIAISAGSSLPLAISDKFKQKFGLSIFQSYGTTETGPASLACFEDSIQKPGWVGKPYKGVAFDVLDADGNHMPLGSEGLIAVKSPANTSGYLNNPEANSEIFRKDFILTGDTGSQDEMENIFIRGRERPMINVAGKKVSPAEVETCIRNHGQVTDVLVVGEKLPNGNEIVKAFVVSSGDITTLELREFCTKTMADFKVPRSIEFVKNLSQGSMGKRIYRIPNQIV
ncbi:MAG: AMP-binding protein [Deltaproteobacteria bacterium]|nr:AMP-binding protein [Deltaproteobacteria bacterium]